MEVESYYMRLQTVDDVSQFIYNIGFPNYVQRFIDNQIDGKKLRLMSSEQLLNLNISVRDVSLIMKRIEQDYPVDESTTQKKQRSDIVMEDGRPTLDLVWMRRGENSTRDPTWKKKAVECQRWQDQVGPIELLQDSMGNPFPRIKTNTLLSGKTILCTLVKPMDDGTFREFSNQPDYLKGNEAKVVDGCADFEDLRYLQTSCVKNSWERWMLKFEVINELYIEPVYSTPFRVRTTSKQFLCSEPIKILSISPEVGCTGQPQEVCVTGIFPRGPTFSIFFGRKEAVFSKGKNLVQLKGSCESSIIVNVQDECLGSVPVRIVTKEPQLPCNDSKIFTFTGEDGPGISFEDLAKVEADGYACGCPSVTLPITKDTVVDDEHDPDKGHSPLHWAAGQGKVKLVEYLVDKRGANVNSRDYEGATPLFWAVWTGSEQCVAFLLKKGANVNTPNYMGFTPLHLSACRGYANITQMLLYYKADGNCVNTFDEVPLSFATDSSIKRLLSTLENPLASPKSQTAAVLTTGPSILNPQQQQSQQLHQPQQHDSNPSDKRVRTDPTGIPLSNNNNHTSSNMMGGLPVRSVQPTNSTTVQSKQMETSRPPLTDAALNAALANSPGWGYGSTPSKSDCTILLANKVIADINMLTQYLETTDPQLLMSSHVPTAHYIMQQFVSGLISAQAQTQAQAQTPGVPAIKSAAAASNPFGGPAPSSMFSSPFMPSSAFATTTTPSNGNNNMPSSPFSPQGMTTTTGPTSSMFAPSNQYGIPQTIKTGLGGSSTPYNVQPLASPTTPTITASPSSTQLKSPSTSTASTNPFAASNLVQPIPMQLSMFKPIARGPLNQSNDVDLSSSTLLDFDFLEVLGTGTFAKVQLCKHKVTKKHYCMKILNKAKIVRLKQVDHVANEKNVLRRISHPNIVKLFRCFKDRSNLYLLLEFVPGGELFNYIRKSGRLPNDVARIYAAEIIMAFEHLHSQRIVYRDLKPENLLLDDYGHIKLTDFGFAKEVRERTYSVCGTPEYIAPEIILNKGHDMAVDWWSLGILIFEMLAGYPPFSEDPASKTTIFEQILYQKVEIPEFFHPHARDLIVKLLEPDSSARMAFVKSSNTLKGHEWFGGLDWQGLYDHRAPGPLNPEVVRDGDTHNFYKYSDVEMQAEELDINVNYDQIFADF